ncbi:ImpA family metalloprotease [Chitinimonas taiwanensis]|uniref:Peptidase M60, enhancin and enhancin-like n=1 Tax=Chitinimonas taiwanensis DSM 18899 TaxID=1121279 RepID=A0A1K2HRD4_9NEIS|nr:ImpA family metalloprotease [Chitinimonas taiwanensis]SFZ78826.1 Peptidase M60, enhancin and enhancin-like [Chitinimonas taiwanensis DSM 18899]
MHALYRPRLLVSTLLLALLAACGGGGGEDGSKPDNGGGTVTPPVSNAIDQALQSGDASALSDANAIAIRARDFTQGLVNRQAGLSAALYQGVSSEYQPTQHSQFVLPANSELAQPLIVGDAGRTLASLSIAQGGRSAGYGINVLDQFRQKANEAHMPAFQRLVSWLVVGQPGATLPASINVAWAGLNATNGLNGLTAAKITAKSLACDPIAENSCGQQADLIIVGGGVNADSGLEAKVRNYLSAGKPVLYLHTNGWGDSASGQQMLSGMGLALGPYAGNYFAADKVAANRSSTSNQASLNQFGAVTPLLTRLASSNFRSDYDWSKCTNSVGKVSCDNVSDLQAEVITPAEQVREQINSFNRAGRNLFSTPNTTLLRLLTLWADTTRKDITYPLDKTKQPAAFQRALIADAWVAYVRAKGTAQGDLGTYMGKTVQGITPSQTDETVTVTLPSESGFTAIGRFALPGQTLQVEVLNAGTATLALRLNTQRTGSTRLWANDGFNRPRYLASPSISLSQGSPLQLSSPYGGNLQLSFSGATLGQQVQLRLRGVARQPFLDLSQGGDKASFVAQINAGQFDWAEIKMPGVEVHSRVDKIKTVLKDDYGNDMDRYLAEMRTLFFEDAYQLAGFALSGKTLPAAVQSLCNTRGWDCSSETVHRVPGTQHINVDAYAECGAGCSGNPYDQSWGLNPRGWGESHELGHNLQQGMLNVYGGRSGEVSNNLFPLHKNWRVLRELEDDRDRGRINYRSAFDMIKAARAEADPIEGAYQRIWGSDAYAVQNGERMAFYMQWVHYWAERNADIAKGWDIITLLYLHQRQFAKLDWAANKDKLGYSQYASRPSVDGNDNLLITLSFLTQRDQRATFDLWGVRYSATAAAQVTSYGYPAEAALFYANSSSNDHATVKKVDMLAANPVWPY